MCPPSGIMGTRCALEHNNRHTLCFCVNIICSVNIIQWKHNVSILGIFINITGPSPLLIILLECINRGYYAVEGSMVFYLLRCWFIFNLAKLVPPPTHNTHKHHPQTTTAMLFTNTTHKTTSDERCAESCLDCKEHTRAQSAHSPILSVAE